jgi:uncharacterized membrane protein
MAAKDTDEVVAQTPGKWFHPHGLLDRTFEIGIILKGLDGVIELIGAMLVAFIPAHTIMALATRLTANELAEDPNDFIAGHILQYANELAGKDKWFATLFLLSHGLIKIILVVGLLRSLPWAYPFAFVTLGAFTLYQMWLIVANHSIGMVLLTLFDLFIIWLTWREYQKFKAEQKRT